ncbi:MAG: hypothetical protein LBH03_05720, partial [Holophagales bacterium]|nr:hypothetical protein [Holophagales bacterium]
RNGASRRQAESEMGVVGGASLSVLFVKGVDYSNFRFHSPCTASQARLWTMSGRDSQANPGIAV